ncbi:MAG: hypothetical protein IT324_04905 [Anaerolineae bacterium]|nr:hypothetical protein [Anaerolineae bacterium]
MTDSRASGELLIRTDPKQMNDVITQVSKAFEVAPLTAEEAANERLLTITPRQPPTTLPRISVLYFTADDPGPVTPAKLRSLFCNPVNVRLEPYAPGIVNDELWVAAAAMLARREGVEQFLVNMLYTLQTALGVEGTARPTDDVPPPETIPPYPADDVGLELPINVRLRADKASLKPLTKHLHLVLILYEQRHTGKAGVKYFSARLSETERDLPTLTVKYMSPQRIFAQPPGFTDEFLQIATDPNVARSLFGNPLYTGVADFPRLMSNERWLKGASLLMREAGIEQYLVNMLYLMRRSIRDWLA